jgi:hypothetical protein
MHFAVTHTVRTFHTEQQPIMVTYNSSADGHYISEKDCQAAGLPILQQSSKVFNRRK